VGCYLCGARSADPVRGPSPWRRGVRAGRQVLVCPDCQAAGDWQADLDRCATCASTALVRRLGETLCRGCGRAEPAPGTGEAHSPPTGDPALGDEVTAALARFFGRA
jgi:hypothetical protein